MHDSYLKLFSVGGVIAHLHGAFQHIQPANLGKTALDRIRRDALVIELASPPYGMNIELAKHMGIQIMVEGGLPGRYAALDAGAALFDALRRTMERDLEGGNSDG